MAETRKCTALSARLPGVQFKNVVVLRQDAEEIARRVNAALRRMLQEPDHPVYGLGPVEEQDAGD